MTNPQRLVMSSLAAALLGLLLACGGAGTTSPSTTGSAAGKKWQYQFVESKKERTEQQDVMDLYAFDRDFNATDLKAFCRERKEKSPAKVFYYVVIFDKASNAKFPSTPFTAEYGVDETVLKHIRAIYCYNKLNGFSELRYHSQNVWDHSPTRVKI